MEYRVKQSDTRFFACTQRLGVSLFPSGPKQSADAWIQSLWPRRPTSQIIKPVLIVVSLFFIASLLPGAGGTEMRGISVVLRLMGSFGSTWTVGNLIACIARAFPRLPNLRGP